MPIVYTHKTIHISISNYMCYVLLHSMYTEFKAFFFFCGFSQFFLQKYFFRPEAYKIANKIINKILIDCNAIASDFFKTFCLV